MKTYNVVIREVKEHIVHVVDQAGDMSPEQVENMGLYGFMRGHIVNSVSNGVEVTEVNQTGGRQ